MTTRPLEGIRVLELGQYISGPYCAMLLADYGAEVVKIERPGVGDPRRQYDPLFTKDTASTSGGFITYNRNKKSVTLNLHDEQGKEIFLQLVRSADVLVENLRPGAMERAGLGHERLLEVNPRLVYCAISGFGRLASRRGPYSDRPAFDTAIQAMSGIMSVIGEVGGPPISSVVGFADVYTAVFGALGICMALVAREGTGKGTFIDQAMYDTSVSLLERSLMVFALTGQVPTRGVDRFAPVGALQTKDGHVAVIIPTDEMWMRFCQAIERPDLLEHPELATVLLRSDRFADLIRPEAEKWTRDRTRAEVVARFNEHGLPAGEVQTIDEVYKCPQVEARGMLIEIDDPVMGAVRLVRTPLMFADQDVPRGDPPPQLGQHTDEVLVSLLGVDPEQLENWRSQGVI